MFINVIWTPKNNNILLPDLGPGQCGIDIVGDNLNPALFIGFDPADALNVYFRIRLNCDPRTNNLAALQNFVWGVVIKDLNGVPQFTARVNAKNNVNAVEVFIANLTNPFAAPSCTAQPIVFGDNGNVEVVTAGSNFDDTPDFFLEFKALLSCFPSGFFNVDHIYCAFTSDDSNSITKEIPPPYPAQGGRTPNINLCGGLAPVSRVTITKTVTPLTATTCSTPPQTFNVSITVTNLSSSTQNIIVIDTINGSFVITTPPVPGTTFTGTLAPAGSVGDSLTFNYTVQGFFPTAGIFPFNTAVVTDESGTPLNFVTGPNIIVTPCRGLLFS